MKSVIKWLENFWYHYKWIVLIAGFFIIAAAIMIVQFVQKDDYDIMILYTGPDTPTANQVRDIENAFESVMSGDYNDDGEKIASLDPLFLMTDEQLKDEKYLKDDEGNPIVINTSEMVNTKNQYSTQIMVGEALICLLDPHWYEVANKQDAFVPLDELLEEVPENAYDECAVYLKDTDFGKYFTAMNAFPEDTLICFRRMSSTSGMKNEKKEKKRYEYNRQMFIDIMEFSAD